MKTAKRVDEYLALPYHVEIVYDRDDDGNDGYVASVRELRGCLSQGATPADAAANIERAMRGWLEVALNHGDAIPESDPDGDYSGQTVIRMPTSLHASLASRAKREKTTLNQLMISLLSGAVGLGRATAARSRRTSARKPQARSASGATTKPAPTQGRRARKGARTDKPAAQPKGRSRRRAKAPV